MHSALRVSINLIPAALALAIIVGVIVVAVRVHHSAPGGAGFSLAETRTYSKMVIAAPIVAALFPVGGLIVSVIALKQTSKEHSVRGRRIAILGLVIATVEISIGIILLSIPSFRSHTYFG